MKGVFRTEPQGDKTRMYISTEQGSKIVVVLDGITVSGLTVEENYEWDSVGEFLKDFVPGLSGSLTWENQ